MGQYTAVHILAFLRISAIYPQRLQDRNISDQQLNMELQKGPELIQASAQNMVE